mmetsp:Transcript_4657/g.6746  ORF Transcript_4657/g.6746 Transcript_4657/m.6746 type:complete len:272 (-) Transcript_4657:260-1075(-)
MLIVLPLLWTTTLLLSEAPTPPTADVSPGTIISTIPSISNFNNNNNENYLPRRLYPGTYKNFCGPTPEITINDGCRSHGWHGDDAEDPVDDACRLHDISYCGCESQLATRQRNGGKTTLVTSSSKLSSVVALRYITRPALVLSRQVDQEFIDCIHKADVALIEKGIQMRGEEQRNNCQNSNALDWFCKEGGTLASFENFNLAIFLHNLDDDEKEVRRKTHTYSLAELERQRKTDMQQELSKGKSLSAAALSESVRHDEEEMLRSVRNMELQ